LSPLRISVIMCVHNGAAHVTEAVESVLAQSVRDFELVVVDDGSTDASAELIAALAARDGRIRLLKREHRGLTRALNEALSEAQGRYIARQDADDVSLPHRFEAQLEYLERRRLDVAFSDFAVFDGSRVLFECRPSADRLLLLRALLLGNRVAHSTWFFRRTLGLSYDPAFERSQDYELWLRLHRRGHRWGVVPASLVKIRRHARAVSATQRSRQRTWGLAAVRKHYPLVWPVTRLVRAALDLGRRF
jgi:glycosyltransferase involved in cell wall biosynthesis